MNQKLSLNNKNKLKEKWKWYTQDNPNGLLLSDINAFDLVYKQMHLFLMSHMCKKV